MFPLNPGGTLQTRLEIAELMEKVVFEANAHVLTSIFQVFAQLEGDFGGEFFRHSSMTDEQRKSLIADHFLFRGADTMQAASGYHEHWSREDEVKRKIVCLGRKVEEFSTTRLRRFCFGLMRVIICESSGMGALLCG